MSRAHTASTIYALASSPGKAGVAVFRISGPFAREALHFLGVTKPLEPRVATLLTLKHNENTIDQAIGLFFSSPYSFTGEDVVELHTHGSRAVTKMLLEALNGISHCRLAEPGEFARRAFLNGKMDLAQAEGIADLIDAETTTQQRQAIRQLGGNTSQRVEALREAILEPLAILEAYIDFPDEEIPESVLVDTTSRINNLIKELKSLLDDNSIGEKIREGLEIVIMGPPNAGKSSLLNALAKRDAAIVSSEAGTTRDLIEVQMEIAGYAVTLVDTAGLRETENSIEAEGIRRTQNRAATADLKLYLNDIVSISESQSIIKSNCDNDTLVIATKSDTATLPKLPFDALPISIKSGTGIAELITQLTDRIAIKMDAHTPPLITRARHREAIKEALDSLTRFGPTAPSNYSAKNFGSRRAPSVKLLAKSRSMIY